MELNEMNERRLLLESIKCNEGRSEFAREEINYESMKRMEELAKE